MAEARGDTVALSPSPTRDQCVFLRGYKICDRNTWITRRLWRKKKRPYDGFVHVSQQNDKQDPGSGPSGSQGPPSGASDDHRGSQPSPPGGDGGSVTGDSSGSEFDEQGSKRSSDSPGLSETGSLDSESFDNVIDEDPDVYMQSSYEKVDELIQPPTYPPLTFEQEYTPLDIVLEYILEVASKSYG
jgi:hypothetical protein